MTCREIVIGVPRCVSQSNALMVVEDGMEDVWHSSCAMGMGSQSCNLSSKG